MIKLIDIITEAGSTAGEEAKRRGLKSIGFGRYVDPSTPSKVIAKSANDRLVAVKPQDQGSPEKGGSPQDKPTPAIARDEPKDYSPLSPDLRGNSQSQQTPMDYGKMNNRELLKHVDKLDKKIVGLSSELTVRGVMSMKSLSQFTKLVDNPKWKKKFDEFKRLKQDKAAAEQESKERIGRR